MGESQIPVDLFNPGQVFACLGFMELAEVLLGDAEAKFVWIDRAHSQFCLSVPGKLAPVEHVLEFLAEATISSIKPVGYSEDNERTKHEYSLVFPANHAEKMALPVKLSVPPDGPSVVMSHWADGSGRNTFKLYSGNRSAEKIVRDMLDGVFEKEKNNKRKGLLKYKGLKHLLSEKKNDLVSNPFDILTPLGGSFNLDPRGAWTSLDAGYSPNTQMHGVVASPLVELLAACGLEHTRPVEYGVRQVRYCVWAELLPVSLARVAIQGGLSFLTTRHFRFELALSGKNKIVTFAKEEVLQ